MKNTNIILKNIKKTTLLIIGSFFLIGFVSSCSSFLGIKENAAPKKGNFIVGAQVWAANCNRCHNIRNASEKNDAQWEVIMSHMRVRANLTAQERADVLEFMQKSN